MAAIAHDSVHVEGPITRTGSTAWLTVATLDASAFKQDNGIYFIKVVAKVRGDDTANATAEWRMAQESGPTTLLTLALLKLEVKSTSVNVGQQYNYFAIFTQPPTAEDVVFQIRTTDTACTTAVDDLFISWFRLDADTTKDTHWFHDTDDSGPTNHDNDITSPSGNGRLALTWTPPVADHDWLVVGHGSIAIGTAGDYYELELFDATGSARMAFHKREGEDTAEQQMQTLVGALEGLPATSQTVQWRTRDTTGTGSVNEYDGCELFAIDLNAVFAQHVINKTPSVSQVDNNFIEANPVTPTTGFDPDVDTAGDWWIMAGATNETNVAGSRTKHRIQIAATTVPTNFDNDPRYMAVFDVADEQYTTVVALENLTTGVKDIDVDVMWQNETGASWAGMTAITFSMELAAAAADDDDLLPSHGALLGAA